MEKMTTLRHHPHHLQILVLAQTDRAHRVHATTITSESGRGGDVLGESRVRVDHRRIKPNSGGGILPIACIVVIVLHDEDDSGEDDIIGRRRSGSDGGAAAVAAADVGGEEDGGEED
ncbi:hypothetical protein LINPERHAP1_LOCUS15683 [Linum perenne]